MPDIPNAEDVDGHNGVEEGTHTTMVWLLGGGQPLADVPDGSTKAASNCTSHGIQNFGRAARHARSCSWRCRDDTVLLWQLPSWQ
jgi:hypothetical protein